MTSGGLCAQHYLISSNLLLFNQLSGSLLNFSHLLIYCEGWCYAQKLSNSTWMKWHITIIMMEKRIVPRHTEGLEETNVYIKASLNGRRQCAEQMSLPRWAFPQRPSQQLCVAGSALASPQDKIPSLSARCLGPWCWPLVTKLDSTCSLAINGEFTHFHVFTLTGGIPCWGQSW